MSQASRRGQSSRRPGRLSQSTYPPQLRHPDHAPSYLSTANDDFHNPDDDGHYILDRRGHPRCAGYRFNPGPRQSDGSAFPDDFMPGGRFGPVPRGSFYNGHGNLDHLDRFALGRVGAPPRDQLGSVYGGLQTEGLGGAGVQLIPESQRIENGQVSAADSSSSRPNTSNSHPAPDPNEDLQDLSEAVREAWEGVQRDPTADIRQHPRYHEGIHLSEIIRHMHPQDPRYPEYMCLLREILEEYRWWSGLPNVEAPGRSAGGHGQGESRRRPAVLYPCHSQTRCSTPGPLQEWPEDMDERGRGLGGRGGRGYGRKSGCVVM